MTELPFVSVLMPVRNEAMFIHRSLGSVIAQTYPPDRMEILVLDGQSDDGTPDRARELGARARDGGRAPVVLLENPGRSVSPAMNIGIERARGDVIVRVDGHCEIDPGYVMGCVDALVRTGADNVGGIQAAVGEGVVGRAIAAAMTSRFGVGGASFHFSTTSAWVDTVYLGAFRRDVFDRVGGFDEDLVRNQDDELNFRITQSGGRVWLEPTLRTVYRPRPSLRAMWKQYFQYGVYKVLVARKRRAVASIRHLVPAAFVGGVASSLVAGLVTRSILIATAIPGLYVLANVAASLAAPRPLGSSRLVLPLAFVTMHVAYGVGFLVGIVRWSVAGVARHP